MKGFPLCLLAFVLIPTAANAARDTKSAKSIQMELVTPGKTQVSNLKSMLGEPLRRVREGASREYYFYGLGTGSTMDATVAVRSGVVEYVTYLCDLDLKEVEKKHSNESSIVRKVNERANAYVGPLEQVLYASRGRGYIYERKSGKVRVCVAWLPGRKLEELGY